LSQRWSFIPVTTIICRHGESLVYERLRADEAIFWLLPVFAYYIELYATSPKSGGSFECRGLQICNPSGIVEV
ncbi:MAG: hypothetical protein JXJ22_06285, partial [Bacteroidales bacterium]|nr:hypothetical protein [Bacteroidales bacterium]